LQVSKLITFPEGASKLNVNSHVSAFINNYLKTMALRISLPLVLFVAHPAPGRGPAYGTDGRSGTAADVRLSTACSSPGELACT
jgi:hypothetical protein